MPGYLYNYFMGSNSKGVQPDNAQKELELDDFEYIRTDEEVIRDERAKIMEIADKVFISTSETTVTYDYNKLVKGDKPLPFERFEETGYKRTCRQIGSLFKNASNYQKVLSDHVIQEYCGRKELTPMRKLQASLDKGDPAALRIRAMLFQLGDDAEIYPANSENDLSFLNERATVVISEAGQIDLQGLGRFTIKNDLISIVDKTGTVIADYKVDRTVMIGSPSADGSVECKITRTFEKIYPNA